MAENLAFLLRFQPIQETALAAFLTVSLLGFEKPCFFKVTDSAADSGGRKLEVSGYGRDSRPTFVVLIRPVRKIDNIPQRLCAAVRCGRENQDGSLLCTSVSVKFFIISASVTSGAVAFFGGEVRMGLPPRFSPLAEFAVVHSLDCPAVPDRRRPSYSVQAFPLSTPADTFQVCRSVFPFYRHT